MMNMCEFCDFGIVRKAIIDKEIDCGFLGGINISLAIDNDFSFGSNNYGDYILDFRADNQVSLRAEYNEDYISDCEKIKINYCPMCGRKLCDETETPIEHFLKSEIERNKLRMNAYAECFDGVHVDNDTRKKLLESHIRFCKNALKQCMGV